MSDKGLAGFYKMSLDAVAEARGMARSILERAYRGPGDTVEAAMHRAERMFGAPATWLHRLRYRELTDMPVSAYVAIARAYEAACGVAERHSEEGLAHAKRELEIAVSEAAALKARLAEIDPDFARYVALADRRADSGGRRSTD